MTSVRKAFVALAMLLWVTAPAASQTGSISGSVFDPNGLPVEGALIKVSGDKLPIGRTFTTGDTGVFQFTLLLPGIYTVEASKQDVGTSKREAVVDLDRDTQLDLVIGIALQESIEVRASQPLVDQKKTEVNFNFKSDEIAALPLERNYRGLFQLIPGVGDNRSTVGPSAGGTRQDNTYLIDGANITNPGFGTLSTEVNELDVAEVNIKRAGISAEFGRTGGVVTNVISRSGTNRLAGQGRIDWMPEAFVADDKDSAFRDLLLTTVISPAIGMGGPFIRDKLFWYGSARYFEERKWDRTNKLNDALPDEVREGHELYGKVTATPVTRHLLNASFRDRPNDVENSIASPSGSMASIANTIDNSSRVATASWGYFLTDRSSVDVRYLYLKENREGTPVTNLGFLPTPFNASNPALMGQYDDPNLANVTTGAYQYFNTQNYRRHEVKATYSQFFDLGNSNHELKVGGGYEFGEEELDRLANGWGTIVSISQSGLPRLRVRYYLEQPAQLGQGRTWSIFLQDNITIGSRLTVNAGVLFNRDAFAQDLAGSGGCPGTIVLQGGPAVYESDGDRCTFLQFGLGDEIQPRLGANLSLRKGVGDKVYVNWGRYYGMDQKSSARSLAPSRIAQTESIFDLAGNVISSRPLASTTGKQIDPDVEPIYNDEFLVGYATPIGGQYSADLFFMYRKTNNFIEDVPTVLPDTGPYAAANLPCARFASCQVADAKRSYKAVTFEVTRRLANSWSGNISYTWSRFEGNFDLDYSASDAVFNTSSFIQDGPGTNVEEPNRFGPLRQDRPHVFKLFGTYVPMDALTLSGYLRVQSGTPWNSRGRDWEGAVLNYLEPAGSHRNPTWTNFDLLAAYRLRFAERASVTLEGRLLNVFGNQTKLSTDAQQFLDLPQIEDAVVPPFFGPYLEPNPFFGTANQYAPPRRLVLAALVQF
jgi:hypothetical protein